MVVSFISINVMDNLPWLELSAVFLFCPITMQFFTAIPKPQITIFVEIGLPANTAGKISSWPVREEGIHKGLKK